MEEITNKKLKVKIGTILVGGMDIASFSSTNTRKNIDFAPLSFTFYYLLQSLLALSVIKSSMQQIGFVIIALALTFITVFAVPAG